MSRKQARDMLAISQLGKCGYTFPYPKSFSSAVECECLGQGSEPFLSIPPVCACAWGREANLEGLNRWCMHRRNNRV